MSERTVTVDGLRAEPGDHVCVFYRGDAERERILLDFLRDGLAAAEHCLCIAADADHARIRAGVPGTNPAALILESLAQTYTRGGTFDRERMLAFWRAWAEQPLPPGVAHRRSVSDMSWLAEAHLASSALAEFLAYEAEATEFARATSAVALCLYDIDTLGGDVILSALRAHPKMLFNGVLLENPYCPTMT